jgi:hypothetical protein
VTAAIREETMKLSGIPARAQRSHRRRPRPGALREALRARAEEAEADRLDRQRQVIFRTLLQAAAFAADVRADKVVVIPKGER